jgi:predicted transcriptional regulator
MNKVLEQAIEKVRALPDEAQEYAASVLEQIAAAGGGVYRLADNERALVREGVADLDSGRIVPDAEMDEFWARHGK